MEKNVRKFDRRLSRYEEKRGNLDNSPSISKENMQECKYLYQTQNLQSNKHGDNSEWGVWFSGYSFALVSYAKNIIAYS